MVTRNSIEERIVNLQQKKAELAELILNNQNVATSKFSRESLLKILNQLHTCELLFAYV